MADSSVISRGAEFAVVPPRPTGPPPLPGSAPPQLPASTDTAPSMSAGNPGVEPQANWQPETPRTEPAVSGPGTSIGERVALALSAPPGLPAESTAKEPESILPPRVLPPPVPPSAKKSPVRQDEPPAKEKSKEAKAGAAPDPEKGNDSEEEEPAADFRLPSWLRDAPSWLISMIVHLVLLIMLGLYTTVTLYKQGAGELLVASADDIGDRLETLTPDDLKLDATALQPLEIPIDHEPISQITLSELQPRGVDAELTAGMGKLIADLATQGAAAGDGLEAIGGSLGGRLNPGARGYLLKQEGGTPQSEAAVEAALKWLAEHQRSDGSWSFDHRSSPKCRNRCSMSGGLAHAPHAATAIALLPFLGRGMTHKHDGPYKKNIENGLYYLTRAMKYQGQAGALYDSSGNMYGHGLAAIVLSEAYGMTHEKNLERPAQSALNFIVLAQDEAGGGWRYNPGQAGDTSVVGWQLMALKSGHMAYLKVPDETIRRASYFLDGVQADEGSAYGYMGPMEFERSPATTAIGLLCRMYIGWQKDHPALLRGVARLATAGPSISVNKGDPTDMYYNYYATQVMHHMGGPQWKAWNEEMREFLIRTQEQEGHAAGSWYFNRGDLGSSSGGRLYCTAMAAMVLEVYYRHLPLYGAQSTRESFFSK